MRSHNTPQICGAHWRDVYGGFGMGDFECVAVNFWQYRFFKPMCLCCFLAYGFSRYFPSAVFPGALSVLLHPLFLFGVLSHKFAARQVTQFKQIKLLRRSKAAPEHRVATAMDEWYTLAKLFARW